MRAVVTAPVAGLSRCVVQCGVVQRRERDDLGREGSLDEARLRRERAERLELWVRRVFTRPVNARRYMVSSGRAFVYAAVFFGLLTILYARDPLTVATGVLLSVVMLGRSLWRFRHARTVSRTAVVHEGLDLNAELEDPRDRPS